MLAVPHRKTAAILAHAYACSRKMRLRDEVGDSTGAASQARQDAKWRCRVLDLSGSRSVWDGMGPLCGVGAQEWARPNPSCVKESLVRDALFQFLPIGDQGSGSHGCYGVSWITDLIRLIRRDELSCLGSRSVNPSRSEELVSDIKS